jgi:hypothetical protein
MVKPIRVDESEYLAGCFVAPVKILAKAGRAPPLGAMILSYLVPYACFPP